MKERNKPVITPSKLLNPFGLSIKPKYFKATHLYLDQIRISRGKCKLNLPELEEKDLRQALFINIPNISSNPSRKSPKAMDFKLNRSFRTQKNIVKDFPANNSFEIPELKYKTFAKFHLPNVKPRPAIKTYTQKKIPVKIQEEIIEQTHKVSSPSPSRVQISDYSKEYGSKLYRVTQITKIAELESS
jgi:hypothetical protein